MLAQRGLQRGLQPLVRLLCSTVAPVDLDAVDPSGKLSPQLPAQSSRVAVPLTRPLHATDGAICFHGPSTPPPTECTTLSNGLRVVSEASSGPTSNIGFYVNSGSIYEGTHTTGASALLECLAFKSTRHRDTIQLMKEVELLGANISANASREQMSYNIDCLRVTLPQALELVADAVTQPAFHPEEVDEQKARLGALVAAPELQITLLAEALLRAAYTGGLAQPLIPDPSQLHHLTPESLSTFVASHYVPARMVLAGSGVEHAQLVALAAPLLEALPATPPPPEPPSAYVGGCVLMPGDAPQANLILAFEYKGGWQDVEGSVVMTVLTFLMGGGNSFSSGGPGKGMHSRLYTRVLNHFSWVHSCTAFSQTFNTTGLLGIQAASDPSHASRMLDVMCREMEALTRPVPSEELERAKAMAVSLIHGALESKAASAEDVGRQYLTYGRRVSGAEYVAAIAALTPGRVAAFVERLLATRPSLAALGEGCEALSYEALASRYAHGATGAAPARGSVFGRLLVGGAR